jgi:fibronectin-binding autotransporter adhesin
LLDDARTTPTINGNLSLPATASIVVGKVTGTTVLGTRGDLNEQVGLAINANITSAGIINKTGLGALLLGGYSSQALTVNVNAGSIVLGPSTGGASNYKSTQIVLNAANTILDMRGNANMQIGSIVSSETTSVIKNFSQTVAGTLTTGSDNTSGTFAGTFASDYSTGALSLTKMGNGVWTLTGDSSGNILGTLAINGNTLTNTSAINLNAATGKLGFVTTNLAEGGTLNLNSSTDLLSDRLGGTTSIGTTTADRVFSNRGGVLNYVGGTGITENFATLTNTAGQSQWNLTNASAQSLINIVTFTAASTTNTGTLVIDAGSNILAWRLLPQAE